MELLRKLAMRQGLGWEGGSNRYYLVKLFYNGSFMRIFDKECYKENNLKSCQWYLMVLVRKKSVPLECTSINVNTSPIK